MTKLNSVLLVDDDTITNFLNERLLRKMDIAEKIFITKNGKEAINFLCNLGAYSDKGEDYECPDLILLDINMPVMDGFEFLEEYDKLDPEMKGRIVVVMLTSSQNKLDMNKISKFKIAETLGKPLTKEVIQNIINKHFARMAKKEND